MSKKFSLPNRNPLPQLLPQQLRHIARNVEERTWQSSEELSVFTSPLCPVSCHLEQAQQLEYLPIKKGDYFGKPEGSWDKVWMKLRIPAANPEQRQRRHLQWNAQGETTVWINKKPWSGLDLAHRSCPLPDEACEIFLECCTWQTGIWLPLPDSEPITPYGLRFDGAFLVLRDSLAWQCHCDLDAILQLLESALKDEPDLRLEEGVGYCRALEKINPRLRKILHYAEQICAAYRSDLQSSQGDLSALRKETLRFFQDFPAESWQPTAAICGHAHIDLVWLWPERATEKKIVHSFSTVMRLMERYPELRFVQSMPALYRMLEKESPELFDEVKEHIASGRWEVMGGFEVEPDTNLPGGEALARSLIIGQKKIEQLQGKKSEIAWIPDVFGYSNCLPQIMKLGGIKYFYTTKMTWSCITKFPYTSFAWRGADGSEILSHLGTVNYNGEMKLDMHLDGIKEHRQIAVHDALLLPTGFGDGGGGTTELQCERAKRFANVSGSPKTKWTTSQAFFEDLATKSDSLPIYQGELYLEYHRGTYTTQSELKRLYRSCEVALQTHEAVRVLQAGAPLDKEEDEKKEKKATSWQRVVFSHFHDAIPGSSIEEVYADLNPELEAIAAQEMKSATQELQASGNVKCAFNPLPFPRTCIVETEEGLAQLKLEAICSSQIKKEKKGEKGKNIDFPILKATETMLDNGKVRAEFSSDGALEKLSIEGEALEFTHPAAFVLSADDPALFDAWDIDHHAVQQGIEIPIGKLELIEKNEHRAILASKAQKIGEKSQLKIHYTLEAGSEHLLITPTVDWQESHKLLRYYIPTAYRGRMARFGSPFGSTLRPQLSGTEADEAMWEVPATRWAAVHHDDERKGLALLAESKLGYAARDGVLSISLLRSPKNPDENADMGKHIMPFAVGAYKKESKLEKEQLSTPMAAEHLFTPPVLAKTEPSHALFQLKNLGSLTPSWVAPSQTCESQGKIGYFIRFHETAGSKGTAQVKFHTKPNEASLVDFFEQPLNESYNLHINAENTVEIPYAPYQILTLLITENKKNTLDHPKVKLCR